MRLVQRVVRIVAFLSVGLGLILSLVLGLLLLDARSAMQDGVDALHAAQSGLTRSQGHVDYGYVRTNVDRAAVDFHRAHTRLQPVSSLLGAFEWIPGIGPTLAAAPNIAAMADDMARGGKHLLTGLRPIVVQKHVSLARALPHIVSARSQFSAACTAFADGQVDRSHVSTGGIRGLSSQIRTFDRLLPQLQVGCRALIVLPGILGFPRPQSYLLAYQNPTELVAAGGFIGSAGVLTFNRGVVRQEFHGTDLRHENLTIPSPEPMQYYNLEPYWLFRDSNWSPDFPTTAALERFFLRLDLHRTVAGTVNITPGVAQDALAVIGPQYIAQYHRLVTSQNVAQLADYYAHWAPVPKALAQTDVHGKQFINLVAQRLFMRLAHLPPRQWLALVERLGPAVERRDIQINFVNRQAQAFVRFIHADGAILPTTSDYLFVVDDNLSYNKINPFIHESVSYSVRVRQDRWLQSTLTLHYRNTTPLIMAGNGIGPGAGRFGSDLDYADFVRVYVPEGAELIDQRGWSQPWSAGPAYGKTMFCGYLVLTHNHSATIRLTYISPPNTFQATDGARYVLHVQHQAGSTLDRLKISVEGAGVTHRQWTVFHPESDVTESTVVKKQPLALLSFPPQPPVIVGGGQWIEPHAYLASPGTG